MTVRTQLAYLHHIRDALLSVLEYTQEGQAAFFASKWFRMPCYETCK